MNKLAAECQLVRQPEGSENTGSTGVLVFRQVAAEVWSLN